MFNKSYFTLAVGGNLTTPQTKMIGAVVEHVGILNSEVAANFTADYAGLIQAQLLVVNGLIAAGITNGAWSGKTGSY